MTALSPLSPAACLRALQQDRAAQHAPAQAPPPRASGPGPSYHGPPAPHGTGHAGPSAAAAAAGGPHAEGSGDLAEGDAGSDDEGVGSGELGSSLLPNPMRDGVAPGITQVITSVPQVRGWRAGQRAAAASRLQCLRSSDCACAQPASWPYLHTSMVHGEPGIDRSWQHAFKLPWHRHRHHLVLPEHTIPAQSPISTSH